MQTRRLSRALDGIGLHQTVLTTRLPGASSNDAMWDRTRILSVGPTLAQWSARWLLSLTWAIAVLGHIWRLCCSVDLVHIHFNHWLSCRLLVLVARLTGRPTVVTFSTDLWVARQNRVVRGLAHWIDRVALRRASHVIALTAGQASRLRDVYGLAGDQISVIPDAIDAPEFRASLKTTTIEGFRRRYSIPTDRKIILYLGRIRAEKGWRDLPPLVNALGPDAFLLICGDGPDRAKLTTAMNRQCLPDDWSITGFVDQADARIALELADVLVLPSRREAFGSVLLEALACGVPAVACRVGGVPDLAGATDAIKLVEPGNTAELIAAVDALLSDRNARSDFAIRGLNRVQDFSLPDAVGATLALYAKTIATGDPHDQRALNPDAPAA